MRQSGSERLQVTPAKVCTDSKLLNWEWVCESVSFLSEVEFSNAGPRACSTRMSLSFFKVNKVFHLNPVCITMEIQRNCAKQDPYSKQYLNFHFKSNYATIPSYADRASLCVKDAIVKLELRQLCFCSASWLLQASVHAAGRSVAEFGCSFFGSETKRVFHCTTPTLQVSWIHLMWIPSWFSKPVFYLIGAIDTAQFRLKTWVLCLISSK